MESVEFEPDVFEVWPENDVAVNVFIHCTTQWRRDTEPTQSGRSLVYGRLKGLDYSALDAVMRMLRVRDRAAVFADVRVMEFTVLELINQGT